MLCLAIATAGCSDALNAGPLDMSDADALTKDLGNKTNLYGKPKLQNAVRQALADLYGANPQAIQVPEGAAPMTASISPTTCITARQRCEVKPIHQGESRNDRSRPQVGGYAIYRRNCLHCHGVSGAGDGTDRDVPLPDPPDYRRGIFKFTSTPSGLLPHRDDLRRTIIYGLHGTSMPAFDPLLTETEIEEVIDYVMFLTSTARPSGDSSRTPAELDENDPRAL